MWKLTDDKGNGDIWCIGTSCRWCRWFMFINNYSTCQKLVRTFSFRCFSLFLLLSILHHLSWAPIEWQWRSVVWRFVWGHSPVFHSWRMLWQPCRLRALISEQTIANNVTRKKLLHTITPPPPCLTGGTTHADNIRSTSLRLTRTQRLEPDISDLDPSDQSTDFQWSNVHPLSFLTQAISLFWLYSLSSGFFAAIRPWGPDSRSFLWRVDVEACLLLKLCEASMWAPIWGAINWRFLRLVTLMNLF